MIRTAETVRMSQMLAAVLGVALLFVSANLGVYNHAEAAAVTNASDTLSNSTPSALSNHTVEFTTENGLVDGETIVLTFDAAFDLTTLTGANDIDVAFNGAATTTAGTAANGVFGYTGVVGQTITLDAPDDGVASSTRLTILIGDHTTSGDSQITNPAATTTSYTVGIGGTMQDTGEVRVAIVDQVVVTASVDTVFNFTVTGVASGATITGSATTTAADTSSAALPFGDLTPGTSKTLAHDLSVVTNAANGFSVTVEQTGDLQSSTGADINSFVDGTHVSTPTAWASPSALIGTDTTYGHWGVNSDDADFSATSDRWVAASTTPQTIFTHGSVANGATTGEGVTRVGYQIEISPLQEAGTDYTTNLIYIATPTF